MEALHFSYGCWTHREHSWIWVVQGVCCITHLGATSTSLVSEVFGRGFHIQPELQTAKLHVALVSCGHHVLLASSLAFLLMLRNQAPRELPEGPAITTQKLRMHVPRDQSVTNGEGSWANVSPSLFHYSHPQQSILTMPLTQGKIPDHLPLNTVTTQHNLSSLSLSMSPRSERRWHPTPVLLPGKSHGWRSLVGCSPWGRTESDTTEVT